MKRKSKGQNRLRDLVFERDSYTCVLCNKAATDLHHVIPRRRGGQDLPQNLVSLCRMHHDLVHGVRWIDLPEDAHTKEEAEQTLFEYVMDCHAHLWEKPYFWEV